MPPYSFCYILHGHEPVPIHDYSAWGEWMWAEGFEQRRRVSYDRLGDVEISTVFMGVDTSGGLGRRRRLFETMIFGGQYDEQQWQYATWDEAETGHAVAVEMVRRAQAGGADREQEDEDVQEDDDGGC